MASQLTDQDLDFDLAALKAKYRAERDKRLRSDGEHQYLEVEADFAHFYETDPHSPPVVRDPIDNEIEVAILGGGFAGLMAGAHVSETGITDFRIIEAAGDFGGTWYWNRYPGIQCDNEAYCYLPLLEEMGFMPSKKFADGWEIQKYARSIADKFGYADKALFHTLIQTLRWDDTIQRWRVGTNRGDDIRARFVILACGVLNMPKLPNLEGIDQFKGKI